MQKGQSKLRQEMVDNSLDDQGYSKLQLLNKCDQQQLDTSKHSKEPIKIMSYNSSAYLQVGMLFSLQKKYVTALKNLKKCILLDPTNQVAHRQIAKIFITLEQYQHANIHLNELLKQNPLDKYANHFLGKYYYNIKDYARAENYLKVAIQSNQPYAKSYLYLANISIQGREYQQADEYFRHAKRLDSRNVGIMMAYNAFKYEVRKYEKDRSKNIKQHTRKFRSLWNKPARKVEVNNQPEKPSDINEEPNDKLEQAKRLLICLVCYNKQRDTLCKPCNHLALCSQCVEMVEKCPVCRKKMNPLKIYIV